MTSTLRHLSWIWLPVKIDPITKEFNPSVNFLQWNKGDGCIYFSTNDEDCRNIYRYSPKDRKFES